jgi:hypothetical protein
MEIPRPYHRARDNSFSRTISFVLPVLEQIFFYDQISQIYKFASKSDIYCSNVVRKLWRVLLCKVFVLAVHKVALAGMEMFLAS